VVERLLKAVRDLIRPRPAVRTRTMTDDSRIEQLLDELANSHATPEEVCANCPELLPEVRDRWLQMRRLRADLDALFPPPEKTGPYSPEEPAGSRKRCPSSSRFLTDTGKEYLHLSLTE
jgi:hypothetical protein